MYTSGYNGHGELYEGWYDSDGNIQRVRHHNNHGNSKTHSKVPHDHKGIKDKNGKPTTSKVPEDPDPDYQTPDSKENNVAEKIVSAACAFYITYRIINGVTGMFAAPATGGMSLIAGLAT